MRITRRHAIQAATASWMVGSIGLRTLDSAEPDSPPSDFPVIDCHTHFFDVERPQGVPWPGRGSPLFRRTLPADYLRIKTHRPVTGTVVVEASPWVEDNQWVLDLARDNKFILGLIGNLPAGMPEFAPLLERFAAHRLFRGIRIGANDLDERLRRPEFVADLRRLADAGLTLDLNGPAASLAAMARLAAELPQLKIVVNHIGGVRVDGESPPAEWRAGLRELAKSPRVYLKLSGAVDYTGRAEGKAPRELAFYRPVFDVLWDSFGPQRLVYGSNWPVCELYAPLAVVQKLAEDFVTARDPKALFAIFAQNARDAYGI